MGRNRRSPSSRFGALDWIHTDAFGRFVNDYRRFRTGWSPDRRFVRRHAEVVNHAGELDAKRAAELIRLGFPFRRDDLSEFFKAPEALLASAEWLRANPQAFDPELSAQIHAGTLTTWLRIKTGTASDRERRAFERSGLMPQPSPRVDAFALGT